MNRRKKRQYDTLLRVRKRQEDLEAQQLADARRAVLHAEQRRTEIEIHQRAALENAGEASDEIPNPSPHRIRRFLEFERHLAGDAVQQDARIRTLERVAETQRAELEGAVKRRRTMEKLIENSVEIDRAETRRADQRTVDEAAAGRYAREIQHEAKEAR